MPGHDIDAALNSRGSSEPASSHAVEAHIAAAPGQSGVRGGAAVCATPDQRAIRILESIADPVVALDRNERFTYVSGPAAQALGKTTEELLGQVIWDVFPEDAKSGCEEAIQRAWSEDRPVTVERYSNALKAWLECYIYPFEDGASIQWHDITKRREIEESLHQMVTRYEQQVRLFDGVASTTPDFVYLFDLRGRFLYANRRLLEVWGMELPEIVGKTCRQLGYEQWHHDMHMSEIAQVIETREPIKGEVPFKAPLTGIFGVYEYIFTPVFGPDGQVETIAGTTRDVTERKQAEEALAKSEERFRALVMATSDVIYRMAPDWSELLQLRGQGFVADTEEPTRSWLEKYIYPDDHARVIQTFQEAIRSNSVFESEHRVLRVDGSVGWTFSRAVPLQDAGGEITEWFGTATNITSRKEAEAAIRESEARERARAGELEAILDAVPLAIFIAKDRDCREIIGSRMTYDMLRLPRGANVSKSAPQPDQPAYRVFRGGTEMPPEDLPAQKAASTGEPVTNFEFDVVYEDGSRRNMLGNAVPLFDDQGRPRGSVGAFVDITEQKRNEEHLRQAQKLESIGLLAGGIAHDFNNLLTGILGNASLVMDEVPAGPAERIREVVNAAERAAHLTRQLLAYSGKGQFIERDLDISAAVQEIGDLVQFSIPKSVQLSLTVEKRLPTVRMDPGQLQQILMNLVINAGEAIGEGNPGRISVATSMRDLTEGFVDAIGEYVAAGRYVCVEIADTGAGIDPAVKSRLFDPFFTTKFTGRGLGLAAVAGIMRAQRGGITVESIAGAGSTFRVFLPAAQARKGQATPRRTAKPLATILVADDEASVREFIAAVLRRSGYRVLTASDGRQALAISQSNDDRIDGAILDIIMPLMGANELLPAMKAIHPNIRILLTSGYNESEARRLCAAYPGADFIQKPYSAQQIMKAVERLVDRRTENSGAEPRE